MTTILDVKNIAAALPIFVEPEQKEKFLFVLGALMTRLISLRKGAEIMGIDAEELLQILDLLGIEFSYLSSEDIEQEQRW
ncbi:MULTISPECIES: hypothetical protein [Okeania]|uniref:Uncharacterized protein n=1 Tax=Okeania hirsuta TaxID=1458930 RepID=A0A3N6NXJ6_9CYAN|nr:MULTISPECIES: hypothetical protein [Okeania]NES92831.1 hypothetical protein [Okeania sp. SIO2B9]NET77752.1 hypothetical protein [Okeania sp. SIO1F9]RQH14532.1 hypothetical protein D4Z78_22455 [Okeania hirsuta]RQH56558.1 hypothetical protein D5R40_01580 [Okeania hirsuta]